MSNTDIFKQITGAYESRYIDGFDSAINTGPSIIGVIKGTYRELKAIKTLSATEDDQWNIVNLSFQNDTQTGFDSVAVLGAADESQASSLAIMQFCRKAWVKVESVVSTTAQGLMRHLDTAHFHNGNKPIQDWQLNNLQDVISGTVPAWDGCSLKSHGGSTVHLLLDIQKHDDHGELLKRFDGLSVLLESLDVEFPDFDSIIVEYKYLENLMNMLHKVMDHTAGGGVKISTVTQSEKPFRHKKVLNIAVSYDFEDGQTISILFHHPDRSAKKINPGDTLVSWKIMMNSRDITGAIQPNQGEGISMPVLASRILKLVNQNSARFQRTQSKKSENAMLLSDTQNRILEKVEQEKALDAEIELLLNQIDTHEQSAATTGSETTVDDSNTQNEADGTSESVMIEYLNQVIEGEINFAEGLDVENKLEEIGSKLPAELNDLFENAVTAYTNYQVNQAALIN
ncbi:defense against restriction DarA-related protein [Acinetobacter chinensis]|uniref:defense against restriction DarA-related protein n=1 Tax=Acinetobacter chinensis TaxID=2004650 RepID=UPI00293477FB|nr:hypothetical protein [Acinetobacter chinensis]WOE40047.1 hypothetical protein QSG87_08985 [Acinetobacter chinensis]